MSMLAGYKAMTNQGDFGRPHSGGGKSDQDGGLGQRLLHSRKGLHRSALVDRMLGRRGPRILLQERNETQFIQEKR